MKFLLLSGVSLRAMRLTMPPMTATEYAAILAWSYGTLGLHHLDGSRPQ